MQPESSIRILWSK